MIDAGRVWAFPRRERQSENSAWHGQILRCDEATNILMIFHVVARIVGENDLGADRADRRLPGRVCLESLLRPMTDQMVSPYRDVPL